MTFLRILLYSLRICSIVLGVCGKLQTLLAFLIREICNSLYGKTIIYEGGIIMKKVEEQKGIKKLMGLIKIFGPKGAKLMNDKQTRIFKF